MVFSHFISWYTTFTATSSASATPLLLLHHFSTKPKKQEKYSVYLDPCTKTGNLTLVKQLKFPFKRSSQNYFTAVGFSNGLFCLTDDLFEFTHTLILWNPAIRRSLTLPKPHVCSCPCDPHMFSLGFGFDHKTHDFKLVRIAYRERANDVNILPLGVDVYKLSTCQWKTVNSKSVFNRKLVIAYTSIYLNGATHWVSHSENESGKIISSLLVFDLSNETFSEMGLPRELAHIASFDLSVTLCRKNISVIWYQTSRDLGPLCDSCVVWVMDQYGKQESWMEEFVVNLNGGISDPIGFTRNGEFMAVQYPGNLLSYDSESTKFKDLDIHGMSDSFFLSKYIESLMLLDGNSVA